MASITQCRNLLKKELFQRSEFVGQYLSEEDLAAAVAEGYQWRNRIWTPTLTVWTFLLQVLHSGCACRAAVAEALVQRAAAGTPLDASPDPTAYCQGRKRLPLSLFRHALQKGFRRRTILAVTTLLLSWIARDILPDRPNRLEPRALKRRPKPYDRLTRPRNEIQKVLLR
jgi:hypothetical protein